MKTRLILYLGITNADNYIQNGLFPHVVNDEIGEIM